jgi:hypothetical protein
MNIQQTLDVANVGASLSEETRILQERLALINSTEVQKKLEEIRELQTRLDSLNRELLDLQKGTLIPGRGNLPSVSSSVTEPKQPGVKRARRANVSIEDAYKKIVEALEAAPVKELSRKRLSEITGFGIPKIAAGIQFASSRFKVGSGPRATVQLLPDNQ